MDYKEEENFNFDKPVNRENTASIKWDRRKFMFGNENVLPMWVADMDFESPPCIVEAIKKRAAHPVYGYSFMTDDYFNAFTGWVKRRHGWNINKDWVLFSPGIVTAINAAILAYSQPGDGVIVQSPVYFPFFNAIKNNHRKQLNNELVYDGSTYKIDFDDLERKAKEAKVLLLSSPHNPVSRCWTKEELEKIGDICLQNNVVIVSDEIHGDLILPEFKHTPTAKISENIANGELSRTIATIPLSFSGNKAKGYVVLSTFISPDLLENLTAISKGYEEYQQIKLLKKPIQVTYYIILSIVALLVLFCAIWFGFYLAKSISIPIKELAEGTRKVAEGDLGFTIAMVADDEIGSLVESFNQMTKDLRISRSQLELSARILRQQNTEIEERRQYMEIVLKNVSTGVISMDAGGFITMVNKSAENMLGINADLIIDKNYKRLLSGKHLEIANEISEKLAFSSGNNVEMPLRLTLNGKPRSFMIHVTGLKNDRGDHVGIVVVFDDLTDQEKAQRMAAWREVARRIAHEVKNPLTPISLSAQRLRRRYSDRIKEEIFDQCTRMIIDQVKLIRNLVNEFSTFARFPDANPKSCHLSPIIEEAVALYRESHPDICFNLDISEDMVKLNLDRQQIKQAMINLLDNAIAAMKRKGEISISLIHDKILKTVKIVVADTGPGISPKDKAHLFEPYFSTKKRGMGLGLTIVSTIIADHKGTIQVQDNHPKGTKFIIELPE